MIRLIVAFSIGISLLSGCVNTPLPEGVYISPFIMVTEVPADED